MYRKEQCLSLLKDPEQDDENRDKVDAEKTPKLKWHKVLFIFYFNYILNKSEGLNNYMLPMSFI
jgi:hypothetical protein